ncbi:MAG: HEAT repeat domain-containing protein [Pseudomonadota bacterium]
MGRYSLHIAFLISTTLSFAFGFLLASNLHEDVSLQASTASQIPNDSSAKVIENQTDQSQLKPGFSNPAFASTGLQTSSENLDTLWKQIQGANTTAAEVAVLSKLEALAANNPAVLEEIMHRYDARVDEKTKRMIKFVLTGGGGQSPNVQAFSLQLAASDDPIRRKDGFELLQAATAAKTPQVSNLAMRTLQNEQDPAILSLAAGALRYAVVDPAQAEIVKAQLYSLTQHQDAAVRAQSLQTLAVWDKTGAAENNLYQGLSDPASQVRQAAIEAIGESGTRSDRLKKQLLSMISSQQEEPITKAGALAVLEKFSLNPNEYASYRKIQGDVSSALKAGDEADGG